MGHPVSGLAIDHGAHERRHGQLDVVVADMREPACQLDGRALGMWVVRVGGPERLMIMTRYESLEHWLGTRAWAQSAGARLKALSRRRDRMIRDTELIAMLALSSTVTSLVPWCSITGALTLSK